MHAAGGGQAVLQPRGRRITQALAGAFQQPLGAIGQHQMQGVALPQQRLGQQPAEQARETF